MTLKQAIPFLANQGIHIPVTNRTPTQNMTLASALMQHVICGRKQRMKSGEGESSSLQRRQSRLSRCGQSPGKRMLIHEIYWAGHGHERETAAVSLRKPLYIYGIRGNKRTRHPLEL
jgi:hypothetical protein